MCHASQILWLTLATHSVNSAVCGLRAKQKDSKKKSVNHVCSEHTVNLWGYHRL